jgi:ParB family chromosome partitioning protein
MVQVADRRSRLSRVAPANTNEQFTPGWMASLVRLVFDGEIDLDPASCAIANEAIRARRFFTVEDDALVQSWEAKTLFFNPPYGRGLIGPMVDKFISELPNIGEAIVLVNSATTTNWYHQLLSHCDAFALPDQRINFWTAEGCSEDLANRLSYQQFPPGGNRYDQTLFYFGGKSDRLRACCLEFAKGWKIAKISK